MAIIIKGSQIASSIKAEIEKDIDMLKKKGVDPTLATVMVGNKPDALSYAASTVKWLGKLNIECRAFHYQESITKEDFLEEINKLNNAKNVHGILLFRPVPEHLNCKELEYAISPVKDVDGMNPVNFGEISSPDDVGYPPCTAEAVIKILKFHNIDISGKHAVVLGRSMVIGKPVSMLLTNESATVTVCHSKTTNIEDICRQADILVAAIGKAGFVTKDFVKPGAVVIDVGINVSECGKVTGDVDYDAVSDIASYITPVPGGVGGVTNAVLAEHIIKAAKTLSQ